MPFTAEMLDEACSHAITHRAEIEESALCACFYCFRTFPPGEIDRWMSDGTAFCPHCGVDSLLGNASGLPVGDETFLRAMYDKWLKAANVRARK